MDLALSIDYISGTATAEAYWDVIGFIDDLCELETQGDSWYIKKHGTHLGTYLPTAFESIRGKIFGGIKTEQEYYLTVVNLPGNFCKKCNQTDLINFLFEKDFNFTRLDLAADDPTKRVSLETVDKAGVEDNYKYVKCYKLIHSKHERGTDLIPTCYFGNSNKIMRYYDADFMHDNGCNRWELQLRDNSARVAAEQVGSDMARIGKIIFSAIDFGIQKEDMFYRFDWWESLREEAKTGDFKLKLPSQDSCFEKSVNWLRDQVSPTLAVAREGLGEEIFRKLIQSIYIDGHSKLKTHHHEWIKELKKEKRQWEQLLSELS